MKTIQFHRNKQELRDELLSFLIVGKSKSKSKKKENKPISQQKHSNRQKSKQKKQISAKDLISQVQQINTGPRIKLKLKKKTQNQVNKVLLPPFQLQQKVLLEQMSSKLNENIKKAIQKQLLSSFYVTEKSKQIDNRKTAYREQDDQNDISQTIHNNQNKEFQQRNLSSNEKTKERQQRCTKILQQRNSKVINSFIHQANITQNQQFNSVNVNVNNKPQTQSIKQSRKFIPQDEVYIPKSFVTFTVKRKEYLKNKKEHQIKQSKQPKSTLSQKEFSMKDFPNQQIQNVKGYQYLNKQKNRSLSSVHFQSQYDNQVDKKIAFYNRYSNNNKSSHSLKKQSSLKAVKSVKMIDVSQQKQFTKESKQIRLKTFGHQENNEYLIEENKKSLKFPLTKTIQRSNKNSVQNNFIKKNQPKEEKNILMQKERKSQILNKNIPLVKMTQSVYEDKCALINSQQQLQQPSLSLTSSLNYSTPFISVIQSDSKQLTINKLSTISKQPYPELSLSESPTKYEQKLLKFTETKQSDNMKNNNDILRSSLTKFKEYEQKKQQILKQKLRIKKQEITKTQDIKTQCQLQEKNQIKQEQFSDFDQIFLESNKIDVLKSTSTRVDVLKYNKIDVNQMRMDKKEQKYNGLDNKKEQIEVRKSFHDKKIKIGEQDRKQQIVQEQMRQKPQLKKVQQQIEIEKKSDEQISRDIRPTDMQMGIGKQQQVKQVQQSIQQVVPIQLQIDESSIQQSVSDFTPQPSLAQIKINNQPLIIINKNEDQVIRESKQQQQKQFKIQYLNKSLQNKDQKIQHKLFKLQQEEKQQFPQQQKVEKSELSFNQFQDYQFNQQQHHQTNNNKDKHYLHFYDFPQWKYNDTRDHLQNTYEKEEEHNNEQIKIIPIPMKQTEKLQQKHSQRHSQKHSQKPSQKHSQRQQISMIQPNSQLKKELLIFPQNKHKPQVTSSERPKSTSTNKVRLIQNIQLSSSQSSSQQQPQNIQYFDNENKQTITSNNIIKKYQRKKQLKNKNYDQTIQNRYYSSSDQQQQQRSQPIHSFNYNNKPTKKQQTKLTLKKQSTMKKTFKNNNNHNQSNKNSDKTQQQKTKQKIIPLGIKINKPKDLFPVLQDSQQWNYGSQSVAQIENNSLTNNKYTESNNFLKDVKVYNDKQIFKGKPNNLIIQKASSLNDEQLDLLEKQFSQPVNYSNIDKNSKQQKSMNRKISITKKQTDQNKSISDFTESQNKNNSNLTQSLSDFSQDQSQNQIQKNQSKPTKYVTLNMKKLPVQQINPLVLNKNTNLSQPPLLKQNKLPKRNTQLSQIQKQRSIVHELKNHVSSLLKRISSQHSISADQNFVTHSDSSQKGKNYNNQSKQQKQNMSFLSNYQPQIKPVSMSSSGSLVSKESFVEQYEQNNVRQSIVRSKNQRQDVSKKENKSRQKSNLFKKYEKDNFKKQIDVEANPFFDFSEKNSSDNQRQRKISSVKKYSENESEQSQKDKSHTQQSQTSQQFANKQDVLKQFDNFAKSSQKDFMKNKSYYLKHKEKERPQSFDLPQQLPILKPNIKRESIQKGTNKSIKDKSYQTIHNVNGKRYVNDSSQGSSGQTINHKDLEVIPQSLFVTNAKNTSSSQLKNSQMKPRESLKIKRGLSISKKISSNSNEQQSNLSGFGKSSSNGSQGSGTFNRNQSQINEQPLSYLAKQKGLQNQFLWNFIMKK